VPASRHRHRLDRSCPSRFGAAHRPGTDCPGPRPLRRRAPKPRQRRLCQPWPHHRPLPPSLRPRRQRRQRRQLPSLPAILAAGCRALRPRRPLLQNRHRPNLPIRRRPSLSQHRLRPRGGRLLPRRESRATPEPATMDRVPRASHNWQYRPLQERAQGKGQTRRPRLWRDRNRRRRQPRPAGRKELSPIGYVCVAVAGTHPRQISIRTASLPIGPIVS